MSLFGGASAGASAGFNFGSDSGSGFGSGSFSSGPGRIQIPKAEGPKAEGPKASRECAGCGGMRMEDAEEEAIKTEELRIEESAAEMGRKGIAGTYSHSALYDARRRGRTCICPFKEHLCEKCGGKRLHPKAEWDLLHEEEEIAKMQKCMQEFGYEVQADETFVTGFTVRLKHPILDRVQGKCRTCTCPIERPPPDPALRGAPGLFGW